MAAYNLSAGEAFWRTRVPARRRHASNAQRVVAFERVLFRWLFENEASLAHAKVIAGVSGAVADGLERSEPQRAAAGFVDLWSGRGTWDAMPVPRRDDVARRMRRTPWRQRWADRWLQAA